MFKTHLETVKEDAVEYWIFNNSFRSENDNFISEIQSTVSDLTKDYIWHKDSFNLHSPLSTQEDLPSHLYGITYYGDNIEDEWFIVYLIVELTKKYEDTLVQVHDNDGEFLLIEAADTLPSWASPDTTENRVFIMNGEVHIIPPEIISINETVSVKDALDCIKTNATLTRANDVIQSAINKKINGYPQCIKDNLHHACVRLPVQYAAVFTMKPSLVAHAVNAYCNRDSLESNICKKIVLENFVDSSVTFTKCLYAMLIHSSLLYKASWKLPPKSSDQHKKSMLGVKLSCGIEILLSQATDVFSSKQWSSFLESLKKNGYFKDNLEYSKDYIKLLDTAKGYFLSNECSNLNAHIGNTIKEIMNKPEFNNICDQIVQNNQIIIQDSDDWLNIDPEEFNNFMTERYGKAKKFKQTDIVTPQTIADELSSFLKQTSDFEGIEMDKESEDEDIVFNCENFTSCVKNILDSLGNNSDSESDFETEENSGNDSEDDDTKQYQQAMEEELSISTMSQSFIKNTEKVDIAKNAYTNFLQSVKEEKGGCGPSSNLLSTLGLGKTPVQLLDSDDDDIEMMN